MDTLRWYDHYAKFLVLSRQQKHGIRLLVAVLSLFLGFVTVYTVTTIGFVMALYKMNLFNSDDLKHNCEDCGRQSWTICWGIRLGQCPQISWGHCLAPSPTISNWLSVAIISEVTGHSVTGRGAPLGAYTTPHSNPSPIAPCFRITAFNETLHYAFYWLQSFFPES